MSPRQVLNSQVVIPGWLASSLAGLLVTLTVGGIAWAHNVSLSIERVSTHVQGINYRLERIEQRP